jgi:uncharacterized protein
VRQVGGPAHAQERCETDERKVVGSSTEQYILVLQETRGQRCLPIWIGPSEATAITLQLQGARPWRPLTMA